jgi:hypothetical protein
MTDLTNITVPARFLRLLDKNASEFTYQVFDDSKKNQVAPLVFTGKVDDPQLNELHDRGGAVYVTVNETDLKGRKSENMTRIRAIYNEADGGERTFPIPPSWTVESSPGHYHYYWSVSDAGEWPADEQGRADFDGVIERMIHDHGSDPAAKGINRVLRVPGFLNRKYGEPFKVRIKAVSGRKYTRQEILAAFPPIAKVKSPPINPGFFDPPDADRIRDALFRINADDREVWREMGMALRAELGDAGRGLWDQWSATSSKFDQRDQDSVWRSFKGNGITIATLFHRAREAGWIDPVEALYERACNKTPEPSGSDDKRAHYIQFARPIVRFEEFGKHIKMDWLIKDMLALGHTSNTFGPPGSGKSALLGSAAVHSGAGATEWMGFPVKRRAASVFFALERGMLTQKRIWAESQRSQFGEVPVVVSPGIINLTDPACVDVIVGTILKAEDDLGLPVELAIIDTMAKGIAAAGGDEDRAKDQNRVYGHFRDVHAKMANWHLLHIAAIGHTGKDESRGQRGSNAAEGDNDVQFQIATDGDIRSVSIYKANEMPEGDLLRFQMVPYRSAEVDDDGKEIEIWIAGKSQQQESPKASRIKLTNNQQTVYRILFDAGPQGLSTLEWNDKAKAVGIGVKRHAALYDIQCALRDKKVVREYGGRWFVDHKSDDPPG